MRHVRAVDSDAVRNADGIMTIDEMEHYVDGCMDAYPDSFLRLFSVLNRKD